MIDKIALYCVCDNEWCWCTNRVEAEIDTDNPPAAAPDVACAECAAGRHVPDLGSRS